MEEKSDISTNMDNHSEQLQISSVSNKLYFTCAYCSRSGDTINILNKCSKCKSSFCPKCLDETMICKSCRKYENKIECYICSASAQDKLASGQAKAQDKLASGQAKLASGQAKLASGQAKLASGQDKICNMCFNIVCEKCYDEMDCICKEGVRCENCRMKKFGSCELCGIMVCNKKCSKRYCYDCNKGCDVCLIKCANCKIHRCQNCNNAHRIAECFDCKEKLIDCNVCIACGNNLCEKCSSSCSCCLFTSCKKCYRNHFRNAEKCDDCDKTLCCNECINPNHDMRNCQYCNEETVCIKTYMISCFQNGCEESIMFELCCKCDVSPKDLINDKFSGQSDEHNLHELNAQYKLSKCCKNIYCATHFSVHSC